MIMQFKVGQKVSVQLDKYPGVWTVKSIGPKNLVLTPDSGGTPLRCPKELVTKPGEKALAAPVAEVSYYPSGSLVRVAGLTGIQVVLKDKGERVNVTKIGGDNAGRYYRVPRRQLTKVELAEIGL
jgi:hypothetical protein